MEQLRVAFGLAARNALCAAFDEAHQSIDAEFYTISDPEVVASLNRAAERHVKVCVHVDGNPHRYERPRSADRENRVVPDDVVIKNLRREFSADVDVVVETHPDQLVHGKAAVVDGATAFISTANPTISGFVSPGDVLIIDSSPRDVAAVEASIAGSVRACTDYVVTGPAPFLRSRINHVLDSKADLRIATEDLSDKQIIDELIARRASGNHDRILIEAKRAKGGGSFSQRVAVQQLRRAGIEVRSLEKKYMHEKYVDGGDEIYVGSANLTRNGLDEAREVGVVAPATALGVGASALRTNFDKNWSQAVPVSA